LRCEAPARVGAGKHPHRHNEGRQRNRDKGVFSLLCLHSFVACWKMHRRGVPARLYQERMRPERGRSVVAPASQPNPNPSGKPLPEEPLPHLRAEKPPAALMRSEIQNQTRPHPITHSPPTAKPKRAPTAMCLRRCIYGRHISRPGAQNSPGIPANYCGILRSCRQGDFVALRGSGPGWRRKASTPAQRGPTEE